MRAIFESHLSRHSVPNLLNETAKQLRKNGPRVHVGLFQRHVDIKIVVQEERHFGKRLPNRKRFHISRFDRRRLISRER